VKGGAERGDCYQRAVRRVNPRKALNDDSNDDGIVMRTVRGPSGVRRENRGGGLYRNAANA